jgi:hypothetical protein
MSELMLRDLFDQSAREFAEQGKNPDNGPYKDQPLKHDMWLSVYHRRVAEIEREQRLAREAA